MNENLVELLALLVARLGHDVTLDLTELHDLMEMKLTINHDWENDKVHLLLVKEVEEVKVPQLEN